MGAGQGADTPGREFFGQESTPRCSGGLGLEDEGSSLPPWYGRQSGQDFLISTRLPEPQAQATHLQNKARTVLGAGESVLGTKPALWASWPETKSGAAGP